MTIEQALQNLYTAARAIAANADVHENLKQSYELLREALNKTQVTDTN